MCNNYWHLRGATLLLADLDTLLVEIVLFCYKVKMHALNIENCCRRVTVGSLLLYIRGCVKSFVHIGKFSIWLLGGNCQKTVEILFF